MADFLNDLKKQTVIVSLIYLAIGLLFVCVPDITAKAIGLILSVALLAFGVFKIIVFFTRRDTDDPDRSSLPAGVVLVIVSLIFFIKPDFLVSIIYVILGLALIINGALKLQVGIELKQSKSAYWSSVAIAAIVAIILGIIAIFAPFSTAKTVIVLVGIGMIACGLFDLVSAIFFIKGE